MLSCCFKKNFYRQLKSEVVIIVWQNSSLSLLPDFTYHCRRTSSQLDRILGCSIWITILQRGIIYLRVINRDKKGQGVPLCAVRWTNLMIGIMHNGSGRAVLCAKMSPCIIRSYLPLFKLNKFGSNPVTFSIWCSIFWEATWISLLKQYFELFSCYPHFSWQWMLSAIIKKKNKKNNWGDCVL